MALKTVVKEKAALLTPEKEGYRSLLENRNFLILWLGQVFSQLGDRVVLVVFIAAIASYLKSHQLPDDEMYNSYLYIAFTIPAILLTAIAGVFADRWPRRLVLVTTNVLRAIFVAFLPLAAATSLFGIYLLAFLLSSATQFFVPAEAATIPMIVRKTQLLAANSLFITTMMASVIFGFALGDPLINVFRMEQVHWAIVGFFVLASVTLCFVKPPPVALENQSNGVDKGVSEAIRQFFAEMRDGIDFIGSHPVVLKLIFNTALLFSTVVALCFLFISYAKHFLYDDPEVASRKFAYIITFSGIGMVLGALLVGRFFRNARQSLLIYGGFLAAGFFLTTLAFVEWIPKEWSVFGLPQMTLSLGFGDVYLETVTLTARMVFTYAMVSLMGVSAACIAIPLQALLQEIIPEDKRGKVMGVQFTVLSTSSTLPAVAVGLGATLLGPKLMLLFIGIPLLALGGIELYRRMGLSRKIGLSHGTSEDW